jgi:hypothetical protein
MSDTDLVMYRGDDRTFTFTLTADGAALDLTYAAIVFTAKRLPADADPVLSYSVGTGVTVTDPTGGVCTVSLSAVDTASLSITRDLRLVWDLQVTIDAVVRTFPEPSTFLRKWGSLVIQRDVT